MNKLTRLKKELASEQASIQARKSSGIGFNDQSRRVLELTKEIKTLETLEKPALRAAALFEAVKTVSRK